MRFNRKSILSNMFVLILVFLTGCGVKGAGTTAPTPPSTKPPVQKTITFKESGQPSNNTVYMEEVSKNNDEITLAVKVKGGTNVYGVSLEIVFDGAKLSYINATEGDHLKQGSAGTSFLKTLEQGSTGILLIGIDAQGNFSGTNGNGILCNIVFKALAEQSGTPVRFNDVNSNLKSPVGKIDETVFIGGDVSYK